MAATVSQPAQQQQQLPMIGGEAITGERFRQLINRVAHLKETGQDKTPEFAQLMMAVRQLQKHTQTQQQMLAQQRQGQQANGSGTNGDARAPSPPLINFSAEQMNLLKIQISAFKYLQQNKPLPETLQQALFNPSAGALVKSQSGSPSQQQALGLPSTSSAALADSKPATDSPKAEPPVQLASGNPLAAIVYPYQTFVRPIDHLETVVPLAQGRGVIMPSLLPRGLDVNDLAEQRERFIAARVNERRAELARLPAVTGQDADEGTKERFLEQAKVRALIEFKALSLLPRQKALREQVMKGFNLATSLTLPADRSGLRRTKKQTLRNARQTEELERKQKTEREQRVRQKHLDHLNAIVTHGRDLGAAHRAHWAKFTKLGKAMAKFHTDAEKEEQRRVERVSKERLKALRADDEEGYLKLIDTAKDTRITHLLRQTDAFLESLATAVEEQQKEAKMADGSYVVVDQKDEEEAVDESRFGAAPVFEEEGPKDKVDYYNVAHRVKETITQQPTILVGGELKSYQLRGLEWMVSLYNNHVNGILADEMGLGKTIQTISLITFLVETKKQNGPYLVIVPLSTMPNWILEFEKWAPSLNVISYKGTPTQRKVTAQQIRQGGWQVLLTTFEYIIKDRPLLSKIKWLHMIIDEGHRMKNTQSRLSQTLTQYYMTRYRLILTGTPLQNNLPELWALLNFVLPKIFGSVKSFDEWFNAPFANTGGQDKIEINEEESLLVIRRLHKVLRPFLLRRLKKDVEADLPDKVERVIKCRMSALQLRMTRQIKEHGMIFTEAGADAKSKPTGIRGLQNQIMQLRKICNHPFTFEAVEKSISTSQANDAMLYRVAGKFELLDRILPKLFRTGHRVLMFFQMTTVMTIFEDYLNFRRIEYLRLDGTTKHEDRATLLKAFNEPNSRYPIFILSTRAGGLGLNLQSADTVIIFDSDWNPHQDLQAQDRAHRIGQKKEVRILRLVTERSVEEHVMAGASRKIEMDKKVIQAGRYDNKSTAEERDEYLRALLDVGAEEEVDDDDEIDELEALNDAIARGEAEKELFTEMDRARKEAEEQAWRAAGNKGKMPERLISDLELPEVYRMDHSMSNVEEEDPVGGRVRQKVHYDDGMSEEQWLRAIEDDEQDIDDVVAKKRARKEKRAASAARKNTVPDSDDDDEDDDDSDDEPISKKRKRNGRGSNTVSVTPSLNGASDDDDDDSSQRGGGKRRKTAVGGSGLPNLRDKMKTSFEDILDAIEDLDHPTMGHQCAGLFQALPSRKDYPDYYAIIKKPISLKEIKRKIDKHQYVSVYDFKEDFHLMIANARMYNDESSAVYEDAVNMLTTFDQLFASKIEGEGGFA